MTAVQARIRTESILLGNPKVRALLDRINAEISDHATAGDNAFTFSLNEFCGPSFDLVAISGVVRTLQMRGFKTEHPEMPIDKNSLYLSISW